MSEETGYTPGDMSDEQKMWKPHVHQTLGLNLMLCITRPQKVCRHPCGHIFVHSHVWNHTRNKRREQKSITQYNLPLKKMCQQEFLRLESFNEHLHFTALHRYHFMHSFFVSSTPPSSPLVLNTSYPLKATDLSSSQAQQTSAAPSNSNRLPDWHQRL